jgi:hypothetical protein
MFKRLEPPFRWFEMGGRGTAIVLKNAAGIR